MPIPTPTPAAAITTRLTDTRRRRAPLSAARSRSETGADCITFVVSDTGLGIPSEKITTLFHDFSQAHGPLSYQLGGTGLGLAIAERFCQLMGGTMYPTPEGVRTAAQMLHRLGVISRLPASHEFIDQEPVARLHREGFFRRLTGLDAAPTP